MTTAHVAKGGKGDPGKRTGVPMQYGHTQTKPLRRLAAIAAVLALHALLIYALMNGLATRVVQIIQHPVQTRIIDMAKPAPPSPPVPLPTVKLPPPKSTVLPIPKKTTPRPPPPKAFVPPSQVAAPSAPPPAISTTQAAPTTPTPPVVTTQAPQAPTAKAPSTTARVVCPNSDQVRATVKYPRQAQQDGITGNVVVTFVVDSQGHVADEQVTTSSDNDQLDAAAVNAVKRFNCVSQGQPVRVQVPFSFSLGQ